MSAGVKSWQAGDSTTALRLLDLAADLAPNDVDVQRWRAGVIRGPATDAATPPPPAAAGSADAPETASALARAGSAPDDFEAHRTLAGALRHMVEAKADATKACELGVSEGCVRAKQVRVP